MVFLVNDTPSAKRKVGFATMEIQKIHMVVYIFSGFAFFTELMCVHRRVDVDR